MRSRAVSVALVALTLTLTGTARAEAQVTCAGFPATIVGTEGRDSITGTSGRDVIVALGGNDRVSGGPGGDVVCLGAGNDALNGGAGDDLFVADAGTDGADSFAGGSGTDTARYAGRTAAVAVSLNNVPDDGARDEDDNIHADVENVVGGAGGDTLRGNAASNVLLGGAGDDLALAEAGADGADRFEGGSGRDTVSYADRASGVRVFLDGAANDGSLPFGEGDNVGGTANDVEIVIGGSGNDVFNIRAFFGGAHLQGRAGDDGFTTTNGIVDRVDGGVGVDSCLTDPTDITVSCGF